MKKLLRLFSMLIVLSLILSSCGKSMYITKRKYTRGYYVSRSHKKSEAKTNSENGTKHLYAKKTSAEENTSGNSGNAAGLHETGNTITANASTQKKVTASEKTALKNKKSASVLIDRNSQIKLLESVLPNKKAAKELKQKLQRDPDSALSLLWVIILVILLVYLIALLFDSFGLGWFIHILALIALILLILWLLRVI